MSSRDSRVSRPPRSRREKLVEGAREPAESSGPVGIRGVAGISVGKPKWAG